MLQSLCFLLPQEIINVSFDPPHKKSSKEHFSIPHAEFGDFGLFVQHSFLVGVVCQGKEY